MRSIWVSPGGANKWRAATRVLVVSFTIANSRASPNALGHCGEWRAPLARSPAGVPPTIGLANAVRWAIWDLGRPTNWTQAIAPSSSSKAGAHLTSGQARLSLANFPNAPGPLWLLVHCKAICPNPRPAPRPSLILSLRHLNLLLLLLLLLRPPAPLERNCFANESNRKRHLASRPKINPLKARAQC